MGWAGGSLCGGKAKKPDHWSGFRYACQREYLAVSERYYEDPL